MLITFSTICTVIFKKFSLHPFFYLFLHSPLSLTIFLEFKRKPTEQASCKSHQLPGGGEWRRERKGALCLTIYDYLKKLCN